MTLDRSVGSCLTNDFLIGGEWATGQIMRLSWKTTADPQGSVVTKHEIRLNGEVIFEGGNHLGCGFDDEMDSFGIWSTGSFPADVTIDNVSFQPLVLLGDTNGDGVVSLLDVASFVACIDSGQFHPAADINQDGVVNLLDVDGFIAILAG